MHKSQIIIYLSVILCICVSCRAQIVKIRPLFSCTDKLDEPYGICSHFTQTSLDYPYQDSLIKITKDLQISNIRFDLWLPYTEKLQGNKRLSIIQNVVRTNVLEDIGQLGILFVGWDNQRAWQKKKEYLNFLDTMLMQYKYIIPYWEVMNEVNETKQKDNVPLDSTILSYMSVLPITYRRIKKANPKIVITSSGFNDVYDGFLDLMCKNKSHLFFDVLNFHCYDVPELFPERFQIISRFMEQYKWKKPVWITECGFSTYAEKKSLSIVKTIEQKELEQAYRIPRIYLIAFSYGVDKVFTYSLRSRENNEYEPEDHFGILHSDLSPKPAFYAFRTLTRMCPSKSTRPKLERYGKLYVASWKKTDGKKVWALWTSKSEEVVKLNIKGKHKIYNLNGYEQSYNSCDYTITPSIIYIVGAKNVDIVN